jgi:glutathione S-transferase
VQRAVIALTEKGVPFERTVIDLAAKPDWFVALSPLGKVPLLQVEDAVIFESAVILEYLEETQPPRLHPDGPLSRAHHRGWIEVASAILADISGFYGAGDPASFEGKRRAITEKLGRVEGALGQGPWFAGEAFSLVDAAFAPVFRYFDAFARIADFGFFKGLQRVPDWRAMLAGRPSVAAAVAADYPDRLWTFLRSRESHLSSLMG